MVPDIARVDSMRVHVVSLISARGCGRGGIKVVAAVVIVAVMVVGRRGSSRGGRMVTGSANGIGWLMTHKN